MSRLPQDKGISAVVHKTDIGGPSNRRADWDVGSKPRERIENESRGEYETEHHSNDLRCAPFTHCGRYYPACPVTRR
jgi:hypothetical protein